MEYLVSLKPSRTVCMQNNGVYIDPFRSKFASQPRDAPSIGTAPILSTVNTRMTIIASLKGWETVFSNTQ